MFSRSALIPLGLIALGWASLEASDANRLSQAQVMWETGQQAMRQGKPARAIDHYMKSLACAPELTKNHLSIAAAYLEMAKEGLARFHLGEYVRSHPEDLLTRVQYAELLVRLDRGNTAKTELESCIESVQELGSSGSLGGPCGAAGQAGQAAQAAQLLIHCHSRLMEIAESQGDFYAEHLNRGIGLLLLARESAAAPEMEKELSSEGLYCKAAGELTLALDERPEEARPSWYLHIVWSRLGQRLPALRCLREAGAAAPFSYLTPAEQRGLQMANPDSSPLPFPKR